jgi:hypothetical protein
VFNSDCGHYKSKIKITNSSTLKATKLLEDGRRVDFGNVMCFKCIHGGNNAGNKWIATELSAYFLFENINIKIHLTIFYSSFSYFENLNYYMDSECLEEGSETTFEPSRKEISKGWFKFRVEKLENLTCTLRDQLIKWSGDGGSNLMYRTREGWEKAKNFNNKIWR